MPKNPTVLTQPIPVVYWITQDGREHQIHQTHVTPEQYALIKNGRQSTISMGCRIDPAIMKGKEEVSFEKVKP